MDALSTAQNAANSTSRGATSGSNNANSLNPPTKSAAGSLAADFNNFLTLLTTQLKAQDPLSPVESTQFVEQLASFSSVEQQIQTNTKLDAIASALGQGDLNSIAQWVGKTVETRADQIRFSGEPISFSAPNSSVYDSVTAAIKNVEGNVVGRIDLEKNDATHSWRGEDGNGGRVLNGDYTIELEYRRDGDVVQSAVASQNGLVEEARLTADGWRLKLSDGGLVSVANVTAILPNQMTVGK
ncbi:MAG: hypothetical protein GC152_14020 [Alphaproteobacteria bacterium]|nr:hypothetical protein [Alphaproteobacteria bacterium]